MREALAEEALSGQGYEVIERNWRCVGGEIDRIAWKDRVLCFIEVRARSTAAFGSPAATISKRKHRKLLQVAGAYLSRFYAKNPPMARFDVVSIVDPGGRAPTMEVIVNALEGFS